MKNAIIIFIAAISLFLIGHNAITFDTFYLIIIGCILTLIIIAGEKNE